MPSHKALRPFSAHFPNFFTSNSVTPDHTLHTFPHHTCHMCVHIFIFSLQISFSSVSPFGKNLLNQFLSGEGNGTPLQYSCLENPMDGGAWCTIVHGVAKSRTRLSDFTFPFSLSCMGEGNGNPLQCSCLENPRDRGAWWAAVYGVAQSWTRLKQLSSSSSNILSEFYNSV